MAVVVVERWREAERRLAPCAGLRLDAKFLVWMALALSPIAPRTPCSQRLAASASESPPPQQQQPQPQSFLSDEERSTLSPSQLEFVERKRRAAAGLGPVVRGCSGAGHCEVLAAQTPLCRIP